MNFAGRSGSFLLNRSLATKADASAKTLTWNEFFAMRRRLQLFQRAAGVPFAFGFLTAESVVLSLPIFDPTKVIFGMDPLVVVGLSTMAGSVAAYFAGVAISGVAWRKLRPQLAQNLEEVPTRATQIASHGTPHD